MPTYSSPQSVLVRERPTQGSAAGGGDLDRNKVVLERSANGRLWIFPGFGAQRPRMGRNLRGLEPLVAMANAAGAADTVSVDRMCNDDDPGWSIEDVVPSLLSVALAPRWSRRRQSRLRMRCGLPRSGVGDRPSTLCREGCPGGTASPAGLGENHRTVQSGRPYRITARVFGDAGAT